METLLKCIWAALLPVAIFFIALNARSRFDRSFGYFGLAQLFLCAMTGIDLWILSEGLDPAAALFWNRMMFPVGCLFAVFYFWYMAELTDWKGPVFIRALGCYALILCALFSTNFMLRLENGLVVRGLIYDLTFPGFMAVCLAGALVLIIRRMRMTAGRERRILVVHLAGFLFLFVFGVLDVLFTYYVSRPFFVSFNTFGSLAFGISTSLIFMERFIHLLGEKDRMHERVRSALRELEEARAMKQVGESAALLNHEIKNHVATIQGNARLLEDGMVPEAFKPRLDRIRRASQSLERLSRGVLGFPDLMKLDKRSEVELADLIEKCAQQVLASQPRYIAWSGPFAPIVVQGDAVKLESVFINLFKNALEAGAGKLRVRAECDGAILKLTVEDDGKGCDAKTIEELGKAFYTTRRGEGGTGLGICVARAIMEGHGGAMNIKSKNLSGTGGTGLIVELTLPNPTLP